jgi:hypothetical protein
MDTNSHISPHDSGLEQFHTGSIRRAEDGSANEQVAKGAHEVDILIANSNTINSHTRELLLQHKPLLHRLFPGKMDRMLAAMERQEVKSAMEFRAHLYSIAVQYQIESVTEVYNAKLTLLKLYGQNQVITFTLGQLLELKTQVDCRQRIFMELIRGKYAYLATVHDMPLLAKRYEKEIEDEFDAFFTFVKGQAAKFEQKANETLRKFY